MSTDPETENAYRIVALFHPRKQRWHEHFQLLEDGRIESLTSEGRTTLLWYPNDDALHLTVTIAGAPALVRRFR